MSRIHQRSSTRGRGQRRKLVWSTTDQSVSIPTTDTANVNLWAPLQVAGSSTLGATVIRTHLRMQMAVAALGDNWRWGLIIGRLSDVGIAVPAGGTLTPQNLELDWMMIDRQYATNEGGAVETRLDVVVDNHSKRKCEELNQTYLLSMSHSLASTQIVTVWCRTLVALP